MVALFKGNKSVERKAGIGRPNRKTANAKVIVEAYSDYFFFFILLFRMKTGCDHSNVTIEGLC
jgi:hypothetical protein